MDKTDTMSVEESKDSRVNEQKKEAYQWKEITNEFFSSVQELELGELLHYEMFGLFEAMSAIEMMDKKMDIGMIDGKEKNTPLTFEVAVQVCFPSNFLFCLNSVQFLPF
jgi:Mak10 subunit, NatC N(alpha)-terminal acetyltransferase